MQSPCAVTAINTLILCVTTSCEIVIKLRQYNNETALLRVFSNQRTNGPVNAHLIPGPRIGTKYTKPEKNKVKK